MSSNTARSVVKSLIGWLIVALLAFWLLGVVIGTVRFFVRFIVWIAIIGLLTVAYFKLQGDDDDD